jgi:hypothetical protein
LRLTNILHAEDSIERRLYKIIRFNARIIRKVEGKSRDDAVYWAIRTLLDSLRTQGSPDGRRIVTGIVEKCYPQHLKNILRYSEWLDVQGSETPIASYLLRD